MATIKVIDVLYQVSNMLLDTSPQFTRFKERELVMWLNDGQRAIAKYLPFSCSRIDVMKLNAGTRQSIANIPANRIKMGDGSTSVNVRGLSLISINRNMGTNGLVAGYPVRVVPSEVQDNIDQSWHMNAGNGSIEHYVYNPILPKDFYVVPAVSPSIDTWVEIAYLAIPNELPLPATDAETLYTSGAAQQALVISLDDSYFDDLVNYILARAYLKDSEYAANQVLASTYTNAFAQSLNAQAQVVMGMNPNLSFLPFSPNQPASAK